MNDLSNVYKLHPKKSMNNLRNVFYDSLESRGVPKMLFVGIINGLNMDLNSHTMTVIQEGINWGGGIDAWKVFLEFREFDRQYNALRPISMGAHSDFED